MTNPFDKFLVPPENSIKTSHSEIETYVRCQRQHYYSYGRELQSRGTSQALERGTLGHAGLEIYYNGIKNGLSKEEVLAKWKEYFLVEDADMGLEVYKVLTEYMDNWWEKDQELEILAVEQEFNIPVTDDYFIKMYVDLIVRVPNVGIVIWDHKFVYNFFDPEVESVLPQLPKYLGACRSVGINVVGAWYNEIRYRNTKETEKDPSKKFMRTVVDINRNRVMRTMREQISAAMQIKQLRDSGIENWEKSVLRAANSNICRNCPFLTICAADLKGEDTTLIEEFSYKKRNRDRNG